MKYFIILILTFTTSLVLAKEENNNWILDRLNIYTENDLFTGTDNSYSSGENFSLLYFIPKEDYLVYNLLGFENQESYSYITFELANKIYTPVDKQTTNLITNDRPYAGWTYFKTTAHKASKNKLRSLSLQVGIIGPSSYAEEFQETIHKIINSPYLYGWKNQLQNEIGINLKYTQKWRYQIDTVSSMEVSIIPFTSIELGNIAINASTGLTTRFGWNIAKDFGMSSLDIGSDPGIPIKGGYANIKKYPWSFSFNFTLSGTAVARDIFLDGNTFKNSHSVEKENIIGNFGFGMTVRYKNLVLDFMEIHNSKQFKTESDSHRYGSLVLSYLF